MTEKEQRSVISRLHRISGQVAGIEKMVEDGAPEEEILIQINAVKQAAHRVGQLLLSQTGRRPQLLDPSFQTASPHCSEYEVDFT